MATEGISGGWGEVRKVTVGQGSLSTAKDLVTPARIRRLNFVSGKELKIRRL